MTRPRRARNRAELPDGAIEWLRGKDHNAWFYLDAPKDLAAFWAEYSATIVAEHIASQPGTRPKRWWQFDAPEPRQRLGGVGTPAHEVLAHSLRLTFGVPVDWVSDSDVRYYEGRATDIHGRPISEHNAGRVFPGAAIDPNDPPQYESEATYLKRLALLLPGEVRRLRPEDFEPEVVLPPEAT